MRLSCVAALLVISVSLFTGCDVNISLPANTDNAADNQNAAAVTPSETGIAAVSREPTFAESTTVIPEPTPAADTPVSQTPMPTLKPSNTPVPATDTPSPTPYAAQADSEQKGSKTGQGDSLWVDETKLDTGSKYHLGMTEDELSAQLAADNISITDQGNGCIFAAPFTFYLDSDGKDNYIGLLMDYAGYAVTTAKNLSGNDTKDDILQKYGQPLADPYAQDGFLLMAYKMDGQYVEFSLDIQDNGTFLNEVAITSDPNMCFSLQGMDLPSDNESPFAWATQQDAMDELARALGDKLYGDYVIIPNGDDSVGGEHVWLFDYGENGADKFTAEAHYAVGDSGAIYIMDILGGGEYVPYDSKP